MVQISYLKLALAFVLAPAAPAIVVGLAVVGWGANVDPFYPALISVSFVTYPHAILLGIPVAIVLIWLDRLTLLRVLVASFLIGALPYAAWIAYLEITIGPGGSSSFNGVPHRIDGRLTTAGWLSTVEGILMCGGLGAIAGIVWWRLAGASVRDAKVGPLPKP